jgi:hypothetical protein
MERVASEIMGLLLSTILNVLSWVAFGDSYSSSGGARRLWKIGNAGMPRALLASDGLKHFRADSRGDREKQEVG